MHKIYLAQDAECRLCMEDAETAEYVICIYPAVTRGKYSIFGELKLKREDRMFTSPKELQSIIPLIIINDNYQNKNYFGILLSVFIDNFSFFLFLLTDIYHIFLNSELFRFNLFLVSSIDLLKQSIFKVLSIISHLLFSFFIRNRFILMKLGYYTLLFLSVEKIIWP